MSEQDSPQSPERRSTERFSASFGLRIEIDGYTDTMEPFYATGSTLNVSRGGLLARVDRPIPLASSCSVLFETTEPDSNAEVRGKVVRSQQSSTGCFVAIEFRHPLEELPVPTEADSEADADAD